MGVAGSGPHASLVALAYHRPAGGKGSSFVRVVEWEPFAHMKYVVGFLQVV